eukprot:Opistho-1_new@104103
MLEKLPNVTRSSFFPPVARTEEAKKEEEGDAYDGMLTALMQRRTELKRLKWLPDLPDRQKRSTDGASVSGDSIASKSTSVALPTLTSRTARKAAASGLASSGSYVRGKLPLVGGKGGSDDEGAAKVRVGFTDDIREKYLQNLPPHFSGMNRHRLGPHDLNKFPREEIEDSNFRMRHVKYNPKLTFVKTESKGKDAHGDDAPEEDWFNAPNTQRELLAIRKASVVDVAPRIMFADPDVVIPKTVSNSGGKLQAPSMRLGKGDRLTSDALARKNNSLAVPRGEGASGATTPSFDGLKDGRDTVTPAFKDPVHARVYPHVAEPLGIPKDLKMTEELMGYQKTFQDILHLDESITQVKAACVRDELATDINHYRVKKAKSHVHATPGSAGGDSDSVTVPASGRILFEPKVEEAVTVDVPQTSAWDVLEAKKKKEWRSAFEKAQEEERHKLCDLLI